MIFSWMLLITERLIITIHPEIKCTTILKMRFSKESFFWGNQDFSEWDYRFYPGQIENILKNNF